MIFCKKKVVYFNVDDAVAKVAYKVDHLDGIGSVRAIEVADLNGKTEIKKVNSIKVDINNEITN